MSETRTGTEPEVVPHEAHAPQDAKPPADAPPDEPARDGLTRPSVAPRATGWREEAMGTALVTAVVGIWLIVSPEALGYAPEDASWNPIVCGVLVVVFSLARATGRWSPATLALITFVIGAWLAISAFILDAPPAGQWNQACFGSIVALLSLIGLAGIQRGRELNPR
jgi:peptidoglycan/LPS O-acetylase OafA/YrhL